ncbi:MAG TPA: MaoC family dehydratase N-terminal domain-containing protein, partial [Dehalococcoidia bacterium]|nr:MaoC family dehydratase N-terminal domain-containing protein [Dehalococcoidia bacterium]
MIDRKDVWSEPRYSPPVSLSDIRKWAIAVYWPEVPPRIFWDEEYAKTTRWGGIIAPQDFNP